MKKYVWIFVVSISVFLVCTYYVTQRVDTVEERVVVPHEALQPHATPHPGAESPKPSPVKPAPQTTSLVGIIQALSGLIAAITGLLGAIKSFRRDPAVSSTAKQ